MIPEWPGLIEASEEKGWADGVEMREMEPMLPSRDAPEAYDAYVTAYWHGDCRCRHDKGWRCEGSVVNDAVNSTDRTCYATARCRCAELLR